MHDCRRHASCRPADVSDVYETFSRDWTVGATLSDPMPAAGRVGVCFGWVANREIGVRPRPELKLTAELRSARTVVGRLNCA